MADLTLPAQYTRMAQAIQEREAADMIVHLSAGFQRILNIGPSWGRDHFALTQAGHQVFNLDVAVQSQLPRFVVANVTQRIPFHDQSFDAVLVAEVLEHLWNDCAALGEIRRVLKDNGRLIVTVPFYHDAPDYHVRIHSPRTIHRLIATTGYKIVDYIERGGLITFPRVIHGMVKLLRYFKQDTRFTQSVIRIDRWLGRQRSILLRYSSAYGCYLAAIKAPSVDFEQLNVGEFAH